MHGGLVRDDGPVTGHGICHMEFNTHISGELLRAARILTGQPHKRLVHELKISASTLKCLERNGVKCQPSITRPSAVRLMQYFDDQGIGFTVIDGRVCGVFRKNAKAYENDITEVAIATE